LDKEAEREELILEAGRQQAERDRIKQDDDGADHGEDSTNGSKSKPPQDRPDQKPFFEGDSDEDRQDWINERMRGRWQYSDGNGRRGGGNDSSNSNGRHTSNDKKLRVIHKYSNGIPLAEAVIVAGKPYFIQMTGRLDFVLLDKLIIDNIVINSLGFTYDCDNN